MTHRQPTKIQKQKDSVSMHAAQVRQLAGRKPAICGVALAEGWGYCL